MTAIYNRFAQFSGAKVSRPTDTDTETDTGTEGESESALEVELPDGLDSDPTDDLSTGEDEADYVQDRFKKNTAPWKNPKITLGVVSALALGAALTGAALFNSNFQLPDFGKTSVAKANDDDIAPQQPQDGKWQSAALGMGLGEGFDKEAQQKNPYLQETPPKTAAAKKVSTKAVVPMNRVASVVPTTMPVDNIPVRPLVRSYPVTPSYGSDRDNSYSPLYSRRAITPVSAPSASTAVASEPEKSSEERRLAALGVTSSGTDNNQNSGYTAAAPSTTPGQPGTQRAGYQEASYLSSEESVIDGVPQQLINRSRKAKGRLIDGVAFTSGASQFMQGQPVEIAIDNPLNTGLPQGAHLIATVDLQSQGNAQTTSSPIRLVPTAIAIGDAEYPLPQGTILLTGENGKPLVAKRQGSQFLRFMGTLAQSAVGNVGSLATTMLGGNPILAAFTPRFSSLPQFNQQQQQTGSEVLALRENTPIQINIIRPLSLPVSSSQFTKDEALAPSATPQTASGAVAQAKPLFPIPQTTDQLAYREPTDAELISILDGQGQLQDQAQSQGPAQPQEQGEQGQEPAPQNQPIQGGEGQDGR